MKNYSYIISVRDDASYSWNNTLQELLESNGLMGGFNYRDSYIAVVVNGKLVTEQCDHDVLEYTTDKIYVKSAGYDTGVANSVIAINGIDYSIRGRGLNIVVFNNDRIVDSVAFDTFGKLLTARR